MKYNFKLDWLSFTYLLDDIPDLLPEFFKDFPELAKIRGSMAESNWKMKYKHCLVWNEDFYIRYDDDATSKGVNVMIPSHGLERFFEVMNCDSIASLLQKLDNRHCRPSRIDIAFDDYTKRFVPTDFMYWNLNGFINSRIRNRSLIGANDTGYTFALGSPKNRTRYIRIYDKEKESGGEIKAIRYELEYHNTNALPVWNLLKCGKSFCFGDLINDAFTVVNADSNNDISRCDLLVEWEDFIKSTLLQSSDVEIPKYSKSARYYRRIIWMETGGAMEAVCSEFYYNLLLHGIQFAIQYLLDKVFNRDLKPESKQLVHATIKELYGIDIN